MILCILLLIGIPIIPAWLLYKIAPQDKFLARGNFSGFQINATGAFAVYIVIFAATYNKVDGVLTDIRNDEKVKLINQIQELKQENTNLLERIPWKVQCRLTLVGVDNSEISDKDYYECLNPDSIHEYPAPLHTDVNSKTISFYIDDEVIKRNSNWSIIFTKENFGATNFCINEQQMDRTSKEIRINAKIVQNNNKNYLNQLPSGGQRVIKDSGLSHPPRVNK